MDCRTCKDLLWEYSDGDLDSNLTRQVDEHLATCPACRQEFTDQAKTVRFLQAHMPVLTLDNAFVQATMKKIASVEASDVFLKRVFGISVALAGLLLVMLVVISPISFSLLWLIGNIIFTLANQGALVIKTTPLLQMISGAVLSALLLIVLAYMRRLAVRRIA